MTQEYIHKLVAAELQLRQHIKQQVLDIIYSRCHTGYGKVKIGILAAYVYQQLHMYGNPHPEFAIYLRQILEEEGFRYTFQNGIKCISGLCWKGESPKNWQHPQASDLPKYYQSRICSAPVFQDPTQLDDL